MNIDRMKTKVCIDCNKRKKLDEFPKQSGCENHKQYSRDGRRGECKRCHQIKTRKAYHSRTTIEERREYMRKYMRTYKKKKDGKVSVN